MADDALQQAADYRTGVGSRLLNLATGGLFGYVSGQQQREQEAEWARRQMLGEQMLRERMREMRRTDIEDRIRAQAEAQQEMLARQEAFLGKQREATKADELESLRAKLRGRGIDIGEPDLETARMMAEQVDVAQKEKERAEKGWVQLNLGGTSIGMPFEQARKWGETNPQIAKALEGQVQERKAPKVTFAPDQFGDMKPTVQFTGDETPEQMSAFLEQIRKGFGQGFGTPQPTPGQPPQPAPVPQIKGFTIKVK